MTVPGSYYQRFNTPGELYAIQTRHCVCDRLRVFKFGRTRDFSKRQRQYPKGSKLIACLPVSHMIDAERMLLALCRKKYISRGDFGAEYFEGDVGDMIGSLVNVVAHFPANCSVVEGTRHAMAKPLATEDDGSDTNTDTDTDTRDVSLSASASAILDTPSIQPVTVPAPEAVMTPTRAMGQATAFVLWVRDNGRLPARNGDGGIGERRWSRWLEAYRVAAKIESACNARSLRRRPHSHEIFDFLDDRIGTAFWR